MRASRRLRAQSGGGRPRLPLQRWSKLTSTRPEPVALTFGRFGSSPSTSPGPFMGAKGREPGRTGRSLSIGLTRLS